MFGLEGRGNNYKN